MKQKSKIAFLGVPISSGAGTHGTEDSPSKLRTLLDLNRNDIYDAGDVIPSYHHQEVLQGVKNLSEIIDINKNLCSRVNQLVSGGYFPIVVGGDHSIALGSISGVLNTKKNLAVVYLDAHGDFNTEDTSPSGNAHGMPCAALMGWCKSGLSHITEIRLPTTHIYWVGARDLDPGEIRLAQKHSLKIYTIDDVRRLSMPVVMNEILNDMDDHCIENIHCSMDVDVMDPSEFSSTGLSVPNGLNNEELYSFLDSLFLSQRICSLDFVEYNPLLDKTGLDAFWCLNVLRYVINKCRCD